MTAFFLLFRREIALAWGRGGGPLLALGFYVATATMFPLAMGPSPARLAGVAGGVSWVGLALASLISLERLFERDFEDGGLDLLSLGPLPLEAVGAIKCLAQWLVTGAPLAIAAPVTAIALGAAPALAPMIAASAAVGGIAFAFLGGTGAALALASRRGGVLIAVIVLPLLIPPVIFGGAAVEAYAAGLDWRTGLALLAAYALAAAALSPFAMAAACRNALS
ncbi:MAG TPA: heme exporter protein CcmB [Caulobacteraceae bacterium]|nr:heme exporter protein CcmB [Caulobacteraceae bacterium]